MNPTARSIQSTQSNQKVMYVFLGLVGWVDLVLKKNVNFSQVSGLD